MFQFVKFFIKNFNECFEKYLFNLMAQDCHYTVLVEKYVSVGSWSILDQSKNQQVQMKMAKWRLVPYSSMLGLISPCRIEWHLAAGPSTVEWHRYPYWVKLIPIGLSCYFGLSGLYWVMMQRGWTRAVKPWTVECHKGLCLVPIGIYFWGYTKDVLSVWPFRQGENLITENIKIA